MHGRNNNPRQLSEHHFNARIGRQTTFSAYIAFYEHAVDKLFRDVSECNETADMVAIPLLFLMRHTMELGYKSSIAQLSALNGTTFNPGAKNGEGHLFVKLHLRLHEEYRKALAGGQVSVNDPEVVEEYFELTKRGMTLFDDLDERSTKFRYPIDQQTPAFPEDAEVNLLELKEACDEAMGLLGTVIDVIASPWVYYG